jgi:hypothetical protein
LPVGDGLGGALKEADRRFSLPHTIRLGCQFTSGIVLPDDDTLFRRSRMILTFNASPP